jgi:hypothetical protein
MLAAIARLDVIADTGAGTAPPLDMAFGAGVANWGPYGFAEGVGVGIASTYIFCKYNLLLI